MCFNDIAAVEAFACEMGAVDKVDAIVATARPTIVFTFETVEDDPLPVGATKLGGFPDLPAPVLWPQRPPYPDARAKADEVPRFGAAFFEPFPLAFIAQFNLEVLAQLDGFDPAMPSRGLLSFFADITWEGDCGKHWIYWHDQPIADFVRTAPPGRLVEFFDAHIVTDAGSRWNARSTSKLLHPASTLTIPDHWQDQGLEGAIDVMAYMDSLGSTPVPSQPERPSDSAEMLLGRERHYLGGWPPTLQFQHPEDHIPRERGGGIDRPGQTPWRNLFCREPGATGRFIHAHSDGGDMIYILIHDDDLKARRFDATETVTIWD